VVRAATREFYSHKNVDWSRDNRGYKYLGDPREHTILAMAVVSVSHGSEVRVFFSIVWCLAIGTICLVYAITDSDAECNVPHHSMDLDLSDFLLWFGVAHLVCVALGVLAFVAAVTASTKALVLLAVLAIPLTLFELAWSIVGAIILFQDCLPCIAQQEGIGIVSLVVLILYWASTPVALSACITCNSTDNTGDP
jgi:hypothetical protein